MSVRMALGAMAGMLLFLTSPCFAIEVVPIQPENPSSVDKLGTSDPTLVGKLNTSDPTFKEQSYLTPFGEQRTASFGDKHFSFSVTMGQGPFTDGTADPNFFGPQFGPGFVGESTPSSLPTGFGNPANTDLHFMVPPR